MRKEKELYCNTIQFIWDWDLFRKRVERLEAKGEGFKEEHTYYEIKGLVEHLEETLRRQGFKVRTVSHLENPTDYIIILE